MTSTDQQEAIRRLCFLVRGLGAAYKGYLPHESAMGDFNSQNPHISPDTRSRLMHIEDAVEEADKIESRCDVGERGSCS